MIEYVIYNVFIVILVTIYHCCIMYNMENAELQGCIGQNVHTGLPLALGKHPRRGGVNPPFAMLCCSSCLC